MARPRDVQIELPSGAVGNLGTHVYDSSGNLVRQIKVPTEGGTLDSLLGAPWRATDCETDICDNFYL
ncbi:MAG: hypothetical protein AAGN66_27430 [Acidobacteriota bacterium]